VLRPCSHACLCVECAVQLVGEGEHREFVGEGEVCPICRAEVTGFDQFGPLDAEAEIVKGQLKMSSKKGQLKMSSKSSDESSMSVPTAIAVDPGRDFLLIRIQELERENAALRTNKR
jgi:hypothetical protein